MARTPDTGLDAVLSGYVGQLASSPQAGLEVQRESACSGPAEFGRSAVFYRGRCRSDCWSVLTDGEEDDVVTVVMMITVTSVAGERERERELSLIHI